MKLIYLHQYFKFPEQPGGTRSYWVSRRLISRGHSVTVVSGSEFKERRVIERDGLKVVFLPVRYNQNMNILRRFYSFISFALKALPEVYRLRKSDLIFATSTPLTIAIPAIFMRVFFRLRYVFEVRDLWPEVPIAMKAIKSGFIVHALRFLERTTYSLADHIITLSPGMTAGVKKVNENKAITELPNFSKTNVFFPRKISNGLPASIGLSPGSFKVIYFGSMGKANAVEYLFDLVKTLRTSDVFVEFVFVGGGSEKPYFMELIEEGGYPNVIVLPRMSQEKLADVVNVCDVSVVSFLDIPVLHTNSPNKLFDSLAAGKPVIVNSAGWTRDLVLDNDCGFYYRPGYEEDVKSYISSLATDSEYYDRQVANCLSLARTTFNEERVTTKLCEVLESSVLSVNDHK